MIEDGKPVVIDGELQTNLGAMELISDDGDTAEYGPRELQDPEPPKACPLCGSGISYHDEGEHDGNGPYWAANCLSCDVVITAMPKIWNVYVDVPKVQDR